MRIAFLPVGDATVASTRYRVLALEPALRAAGHETSVRYPVTAGPARLARAADLLRDASLPPAADVLVVHRKTYPPRFAVQLPRPGRPLAWDIDDALDLPPPGRAADDATLQRYRANFDATAAAADLVLCGNAELARRVPHGRTEVVPTSIDTARFAPGAARSAEGSVLGWVGHSDNLGYLAALAEPLRELARRHPALRVVVVADRPLEIPGVTVEFRRWTLAGEVSAFDGIAVGLMPLADDAWTRGKCAFKAIQYMALGLPAVASPVGANLEVIEDGVSGFLPRTPGDWVDALDALLSDAALAARIGAAGRAVVERRYALDVVATQVERALSRLVAR